MTEVHLRLLDSSFTLRGPATTLREIVRLAPAGVHDASTAVELQLDARDTVPDVLTLLNRTALAQCRSFAVHSGVVSTGDVAIAFPAESGAGKSTLTAACLRAGFRYLSDEALVVDWDEEHVRPYPKWLSLSEWSAQQLGLPAGPDDEERSWTAADLGSCAVPAFLRLGHIVLIDRRPGPPELVALSRAVAARHLLQLSFNHYQRPQQAFVLAVRLARGAEAWTLGVDNPVAAAELLADVLSVQRR